MKKLLLALAICVSSTGFAQVLDVASVQKLNTPSNTDNTVVGISPKGDFILLSTAQNVGLTKYDLSSGESSVVTTAPGAGFGAQISNDGSTIVYRETSFGANHLRKASLKTKNLSTGESATILSDSRDIQAVAMDGNSLISINKGKKIAKSLNTEKVKANAPVLSINNGKLMITRNGNTKDFSPNGKQFSYIWQSVSPDASKALYYICGVGAFVWNIDGTNVKSLGKIRAPKWYNNDIVIGMNDIDNGDVVLSSSIVATTLNGVKQTLTDNSCIAMYPYASADGSKIVCSNPSGEAYMININVK